MALALVRFAGPDDAGHLRFDAELGGNRFFAYAIGSEGERRAGSAGVPMLADRHFTSPVLGPIPDSPTGRTSFIVPASQFDREHPYLQLSSFRTRDLAGPALSEIIRVPFTAASDDFLPRLDLGLELPMPTYTQSTPVAFSWRERDPLAETMFLEQLIPTLQKVLPGLQKIMPMVGDIIGSFTGGALQGGLQQVAAPAAPPAASAPPANPAPAPGPAAKPADPAPAANPLLSGVPRGVDPQTQAVFSELAKKVGELLEERAAASNGRAKAKSLALGAAQPQYSEAKIAFAALAPMLIQALPALMPLLEKGVTAGKDLLVDFAKMGNEDKKMLLEHLEKINPMQVHAAVDDLLKGMSLASGMAAGADAVPPYRRVFAAKLTFADLLPQVVQGRPRLCFRADGPMSFPLLLDTPRKIEGATLHLTVRRAGSREVLATVRADAGDLEPGRLPVSPALDDSQRARLRPGEDVLATAHLVWKTRKGELVGTRQTVRLSIVGEFLFDRVEDSGTLIPLADIARYRDFWHKAWQGSFTDDLRRVECQGKYYYSLEPARAGNARVETLTKQEPGRDRVAVIRLKTGMVMSPAALNRLLPQLEPAAAPLGEPELAALRTPDFARRFSQAARFSASFHGRTGASAALWIYPELKLQTVVLLRAARSAGTGHVQAFEERRVRFPMPAVIHTIGARTQS
ncbi:MAG TPA: hypothetical protein VGD77_17540 [Gemmatimonadaceae bacterium]